MQITDVYAIKGPSFRKHKSLATCTTNNTSAMKIQTSIQTNPNGKQTVLSIKPRKSPNNDAFILPLNLHSSYNGNMVKLKKNDQFDNNHYQPTDVSSIDAVDDILSMFQSIQAKANAQSRASINDKMNSFVQLSKFPITAKNTSVKIIHSTSLTGVSLQKNTNKEQREPMKGLVRTNTHSQSFKHNYHLDDTLSKASNELKTKNESDLAYKDNLIVNTLLSKPNPSVLASASASDSVTTSTTSNKPSHRRTISLNLASSSSSSFQTIISYADLLLIEDNLHDILSVLTLNHPPEDQCLQWWLNYLNSSLKANYSEYFLNAANKRKIKVYSTMELLSVLLCYILSTNKEVFNIYIKEFNSIFTSLHFNFLLLIKFIITKQKGNDINFDKINLMLMKSLTSINERDIEEFIITRLITHNVNDISETYINIIKGAFKDSDDEELLYNYLYKAHHNRHWITMEELNLFLNENILKGHYESKFKPPIRPTVPYLPFKSKYAYTIVLDLDETLVHLIDDSDENYNDYNKDKAAIDIRPGLFDFLKKLKNKYEIVLFTAGTQDYADSIINIIESKEKYFDYRLYREHTLEVNNEYIKDLWKLGRDLSKIIIVDDKPQNYQLQKENGISIQPFLGGECYIDTLGHLSQILTQIFENGGDVRDSLVKYKDDIATKVSIS